MFGQSHKQAIRELVNNCVMLVQPELDLSQRDLKTLPKDFVESVRIGRLQALETLKLQNNYLSSLPGELGLLINLKVLLLEHNRITGNPDTNVTDGSGLPAGLAGCAQLVHLDASHNALTTLCDQLCCAWTHLQQLNLSTNNITALPPQFGQLSSLTELNVANNRLERLPASLGELSNLRVLIADNNLLAELPTSIGSLSQLAFISANNNRLQYLPEEMLGCVQLATFHATGNPKLTLPLALSKLYKSEILHSMTTSAATLINPRWRPNPADIIDFLRFATHFKIEVVPKSHWQPNEEVQACPDCREAFGWLKRKHHCRICGRVLCDTCCQNAMMIDVLDSWSPSRLCASCHQLTHSSKAIGSAGTGPSSSAPSSSSSAAPSSSGGAKGKATPSKQAETVQWRLSDADRALSSELQRQKLQSNIEKLRGAIDKKRKETANLQKLKGFYQNDPAGRADVEKTLAQNTHELDELQGILDELSFELTTFMVEPSPSSNLQPAASSFAIPQRPAPVPVVESAPQVAAVEEEYATCIAAFDYESREAGILSFQQGDRMSILNDDDPEWIYVMLNGQEGYVPATYVERQA